MKKGMSRLLSMSVLMLLWVVPDSMAAEKGGPSEALGILVAQLEFIYLKPMGEQFAGYPRRDPESFAALLGATMQSQELYLNEHMEYERQFEALRDEVVRELRKLADDLGNRNPNTGEELTGTAMEFYFYRGLNGGYNQSIMDSLGVDPARVGLKMVLDKVDVGQTAQADVRGSGNRRSPDSIELLGQEPEYPEAGGIICPPLNSDSSLTLDNNDNPRDGTYVKCTYFESGKLRKQTPYVNDKLEGHDIGYTEKENYYYISYDFPYINGKRDGVGRQWSTTRPYGGDVSPYHSVVAPYSNGKREGVHEQFTVMLNGQRIRRSRDNYSNDKLDGLSESWGFTIESGKWGKPANTVYRQSVINYRNGKKHGTETWYWPDGDIKEVSNWVNGQRTSTSGDGF